MSIFTGIRNFIVFHLPQGLQRRFRFPALAEANKALFALEQMVNDPKQISQQLEMYKNAQDISEKKRDIAFIPIYFSLEQFIVSHQPPIVTAVMTKDQVREKIKQVVELDKMSEEFRLIFLPSNQQADHLLKIGSLEFLEFLSTSFGQAQLLEVIKQSVGQTPLGKIAVSDDGISFDAVHPGFQSTDIGVIGDSYKRLYQALYEEIKNIFGVETARSLTNTSYKRIKDTYEDELVSLFINTLPEEARP